MTTAPRSSAYGQAWRALTLAAEERNLLFHAEGGLLGAGVVDGDVAAVMFKDKTVAWFHQGVNVATPVRPERINEFFRTHDKQVQEFLKHVRDRPDTTGDPQPKEDNGKTG